VTPWTTTELWCLLSSTASALGFFWAQWHRGRAEARAEAAEDRAYRAADAQKALEPEPDDEPSPIFTVGELVDVDVTDLTRVRGRFVGVVETAAGLRFVVQCGRTNFTAHPDDVDRVEDGTVGYRESAKDLN